jgi:small-conductance mechanosensitive channel
MSSLPFSIGDIVEINEECISDDPTLSDLLGQRGRVETMGISWVKISIGDRPQRFKR